MLCVIFDLVDLQQTIYEIFQWVVIATTAKLSLRPDAHQAWRGLHRPKQQHENVSFTTFLDDTRRGLAEEKSQRDSTFTPIFVPDWLFHQTTHFLIEAVKTNWTIGSLDFSLFRARIKRSRLSLSNGHIDSKMSVSFENSSKVIIIGIWFLLI